MLESTEYATIKLLSVVKSMYGIPRYGHTRDISLIFSEDEAMRKDYMLGLILVFAILMGIAATWFLSLIVLRILGHTVGCAAGRPAIIPAEPMGDNEKGSVKTDETGEFIVMQADQNRVNRTRIVFFMSVLYALAASGVLIWSFIKMQSSGQQFYEYAEDIKDGFAQMPDSLSTAVTASTSFQTPKNVMVAELMSFCPTSTETVGGQDPSLVTEAFYTALSQVGDLAAESSWNTFKSTVDDINEILVGAVSFIGFLEGPKEIWYIGLLCAAGALVLLIFYMLACAWKSGKEGYEFAGEAETDCNGIFLNFVGIPLFALLMAGAWFVTALAFTTGAANADFCYSEIRTGDTVLASLRNLQFEETSELYRQTDDYMHGCVDGVSATMPQADTYNVALNEAQSIAGVFTSFNVAELDAACVGDASTVIANAQALSTDLKSLIADYGKVYDNMSCEAIAPLMQKSVYETSCQSMSKAFLWTFASGLTLSIFGSIILSLRSATQRPQIYMVQAVQTQSKSNDNDDASYIVDSEDEY